MEKTKERSCVDCLHCKVSVKSTDKNRLCYCVMAEKVKDRKELYWSVKKTCNTFAGMD
jgi:hypothetical protein